MAFTGAQLLGIEPPWSINMAKVEGYYVSDEYTLPLPKNSARLVRKQVKRDVDTSMPVYPENPLIRWRIPSNGQVICDFRRAKVIVDASVGVSAPYSARPSTLFWNIIDRFRLEQGGQYIEDRRFFGLQETLVYVVQTHVVQQITTGVALYGDGSQTARNARATNWRYILPLPTTGLVKSIYPWFQVKNISNGVGTIVALPDTYLQWELVQPQAFVEAYGGTGTVTGLTYTIMRMQIEYEEIYPMGGPSMLLKNWLTPSQFALKGGFPRIWYRTFLTNTYPLTTNNEQTIYIDMKLSSIIYIYATFRYAANTYNPLIYDKFSDYISRNDMPLIEFQWEVNSCLWPDKPVSLTDPSWVEGYAKYLESWSMFHARGIQQEVTPITINAYLNDKFVLPFDGNENPFSPAMLNPVSTAYSGSIIQLKLKFSAPPPAGIEVVIHAYHWRCWNFGASGSVPLVET
jgi:hypothetical protein